MITIIVIIHIIVIIQGAARLRAAGPRQRHVEAQVDRLPRAGAGRAGEAPRAYKHERMSGWVCICHKYVRQYHVKHKSH